MADARGQAHALTVVTPVTAGREGRLREALDALPEGETSPLARLDGTHFARWVVVPGLMDGDALETPEREHLLFSSTFDGPADAYLAAMPRAIPEEADAVWGQCDGYPGAGDERRFAGYMLRHRLRTNLFVAAYPDATVPEVRQALALRRRLRAFAPRAQAMAPAELQAAFREAFPP